MAQRGIAHAASRRHRGIARHLFHLIARKKLGSSSENIGVARSALIINKLGGGIASRRGSSISVGARRQLAAHHGGAQRRQQLGGIAAA